MPSVTRWKSDSVSGFLHSAEAPPRGALVLTHGAGSNCQSALLVKVAEHFSSIGFTVMRCDLPFRQARPYGPPHPSQAARDRQGLSAAVDEIRRIAPGPVILGGHSYGGRQASILVSEQPGIADALLLLSYPLHPPNKPGQLRTAHFASVRIPALFVHGTKDPFGTVDEIRSAINLFTGGAELSIVAGAGHDLARGSFDVGKLVIEPITRLAAARLSQHQ